MVVFSVQHQKQCLLGPIPVSVVFGGVFTVINSAQGVPVTPKLLGSNIGIIYMYNAIQCPMEAIQGRQSAMHNVASGAILGYVGVSRGMLGIPFVDASLFYRYPQLSPPLVAAAVYGGCAGVLATIGGKPF